MNQGHFLNDILGLEDEFYAEGHTLGTLDGTRAGFNEGSVFAIENGFEKFQTIGRLYGKGIIWAKRLPNRQEMLRSTPQLAHKSNDEVQHAKSNTTLSVAPDIKPIPAQDLPSLPCNPRLEKHIAVYLSLVNPLTLSMENKEEAVADFDDRLKKAVAKARVIEKMAGEPSEHTSQSSRGASNIEDIGSLPIDLPGNQKPRNSTPYYNSLQTIQFTELNHNGQNITPPMVHFDWERERLRENEQYAFDWSLDDSPVYH
ncbi:DUF1715 domain-containing protein [Microsporum canis CBS 113480]|uniref:DUF1715 domain-containing protein n=1 Tax=Arthroderma otae (strain ATCC MYA-4605 / CBS 113480) TaxID=554155 RepID=C5FFF3_ARTOC|nr:DUF1715 domain-containing protein [Microsporum canis CBS 113480]EEQ28537.1 DUF1715 domain-containing protein [Microsporum canis CBS 113480]